MKSFTYYGSGWSETVMNIGDEWSLMNSVLSIAIDAYKDYDKFHNAIIGKKED